MYFVTGNDKKWKEIQEIMGETAIFKDLKRSTIDLPELQGSCLSEIAIKKAQIASQSLGNVPVLVEDTALGFEAMGGLPGAYIKWFVESVGVERIPRMLDGFAGESDGVKMTDGESRSDPRSLASALSSATEQDSDPLAYRKATATCTVVYCSPAVTLVFTGSTTGIILPEAKGGNAFNWDCIFAPEEGRTEDGQWLSYAEMPSEEKNKISHRGRALEKLKAAIERGELL